MSQFSKLIDEVADQKCHSLSDVLLKAKVLASRLRSRKFRQWVDSEIKGYSSSQPIPDYRIIPATVHGIFAGYGGSEARIPLSTYHLDEHWRQLLTKARVYNGVAYIESLNDKDDSTLGVWMQQNVVELFRTCGPFVDDMELNLVSRAVSVQSMVGLLSSVRSRLLDFLLELKDHNPDLEQNDQAVTSISEAEVDAAVDRRVFQHCTVYEKPEMRDSFHAGQVGAMGPNARAENMNFIQVLRDGIGGSSLADLAADLERLRSEMLVESKSASQDSAVTAVADAEAAAKKGDAKSVLESLKAAGQWAADVAKSVGADVAGKAVAASLGL